MLVLKKLIFALFFLIFFAILLTQISPLLKSADFIFSISANSLIQLIIICLLIMLTSFSFVLFASFSADWKYILPVGVITAVIPFFFFETALAIVLIIAFSLSILITFVSLDNTLKTYINFSPSTLFGPSIRNLGGLLILSICLMYFLSNNKMITEKGFQIPDSLINTALKFAPALQSEEAPTQSLPQILPEQLNLLKSNPELLKQSGIDPKILDTIGKPVQNIANDLIGKTLKKQFQDLIKPYTNIIPIILAALLFLTLQSFMAVIDLLIRPLLWIIFYVLEKTGFIKFTEESRLVKKLVIS